MNISYGLLSAVVTSAPAEKLAPLSLAASLQLAVSGIIIVLIALAVLGVLVLAMSKIVPAILGTSKTVAAAPVAPVASAPVVAPKPVDTLAPGMAVLPANQSRGELNLYNVDDKTAAMIMAIVSDSTKIPLNQLYFKSIKAL